MTDNITPSFIAALSETLSDGAVITERNALARFNIQERNLFQGAARIVVAPRSTTEVALCVSLCHAHRIAISPQGGNTGLVGGTLSTAGQVVISLHRMNRIDALDPQSRLITVEAGCILADVQRAAEAADCIFPLVLGSEGSCTIGGNIASNAGGNNVIRYGNMRDLTLGVEVVLANGMIWDGMRALHKDNSRYALRHLFLGSEGTLGVVTRAVLKLYPALRQTEMALCGFDRIEDALSVLEAAGRLSGGEVTLFELMSDFCLDICCKHTGLAFPLGTRTRWYALVELSTSRQGNDLRATLEAILGDALERGALQDAVIAESREQMAKLRRMREATSEAQKREGGSIKHDVAVPVSEIPRLIEQASQAVLSILPESRICAFGHVGDGNIHFNVSQPVGMDREAFLALWVEISDHVHELVDRLGGSIAAEHGIGVLKVGEVQKFRSPADKFLMAAIKDAIDPGGIMNPGKMVSPARSLYPSLDEATKAR